MQKISLHWLAYSLYEPGMTATKLGEEMYAWMGGEDEDIPEIYFDVAATLVMRMEES